MGGDAQRVDVRACKASQAECDRAVAPTEGLCRKVLETLWFGTDREVGDAYRNSGGVSHSGAQKASERLIGARCHRLFDIPGSNPGSAS